MLFHFFVLAASLAVLLKASDYFVKYAVVLAERFRISKMVIGMTVVAVGTSLPEAAASVIAAIEGYSEIALGNVVGSNICNIGLIIGLSACFVGVNCTRAVLRREGVILLATSFSLLIVGFYDHGISRLLGFTYLALFGLFIFWMFNDKTPDNIEEDSEIDLNASMVKIWLMLGSSLVFLLLASDFLVKSVVAVATELGVSQNIIAITLIAVGTSLPELSVSISSAKRGEGDILVGNIIGSNISNILLVLGLASLLQPISIAPISAHLDIPIMVGFAVLLSAFLYSAAGVTRARGIVLLGLYSLVIVRCVLIPT